MLQAYYTVLCKVLLVERLEMAILHHTLRTHDHIHKTQKNVRNSIIEFIIVVTH